MHLQCMYNVFILRLGSTSIGHARHVKTRNDNGLRIWIFSQKLPFSVEKKCFKDKNYGSTIHYTYSHITNRRCGSMKSVSSLSSIDFISKFQKNIYLIKHGGKHGVCLFGFFFQCSVRWRRRHYLLRAANFDLYSAFMAIEQ